MKKNNYIQDYRYSHCHLAYTLCTWMQKNLVFNFDKHVNMQACEHTSYSQLHLLDVAGYSISILIFHPSILSSEIVDNP